MGQAGWCNAELLAMRGTANCPADIVQAPGDEQPREQCGPHGRVQVLWGARNKLGQLLHGPEEVLEYLGTGDVRLDLGICEEY